MNGSPRLLLVDDDSAERAVMGDALVELLGGSVRQAGSIAAALDAAAAERFDAAILDVGLPDGDGRDLCATLRRRGNTMPIVMLTGYGDEMDIVRGLDSGANDYVVKPFRPHEIAARLRAQLRQHDVSEHAEMTVGHQLFRPGDKTLSEPGRSRPVRLTEKEAAVLKYLYRADGQLVTREQLLHHVWGYNAEAATHTVETHVYRLRRKVEPHANSPRILLHERGGYRLLRAEIPALTAKHVERHPSHRSMVSARMFAEPAG